MQRLRTGQVLERICGQANLGCDIFEEVFHRTAAGLVEITNPVIHILEDISELVSLNADRASSKSKPLEIFKRRVGNLGALCDIVDCAESTSKSNSETGQGSGRRRGCCNKRRLDCRAKLAGLSLGAFNTVLEFSSVETKVDA
ncbi:hypothetical protein [Agrobacterium sp. SORGH_AS_0745]|uniref:hypothetical protein n=1 Tax=Agrobacterium sp. SORGH_AS_0745 TaxID=3041773 RepID=UPI0027BA4276|nr:hypothetical protein [Agrobacterium sp. SORGH_AS_0745]